MKHFLTPFGLCHFYFWVVFSSSCFGFGLFVFSPSPSLSLLSLNVDVAELLTEAFFSLH